MQKGPCFRKIAPRARSRHEKIFSLILRSCFEIIQKNLLSIIWMQASWTMVSAVSQYLFQTRELVLQLLNDFRSALAVMQVGLMNGDGHREPQCINHNMFLAPFDLFVAVNPSISIHMMRRFYTSRIDDSHAWTFRPAIFRAKE